MTRTKQTITIPITDLSAGQPTQIIFEHSNGHSSIFFEVGDKKYSMKTASAKLFAAFIDNVRMDCSLTLGEDY